ncbi:MAG: energy-coupling factor transporter transmembrane component T family protein [Anaerolineae bacterium]
MNGLVIGGYVPGDSILHRLDPRIKMGASLALMMVPFAINTWQGYGILSGFLILLAALSRISPRAFLRTLRTVLWIGVFMFFMYLFTTPGTPIVAFGGLAVTWEGVAAGAVLAYRLCLLVIVASLLTLTTSPIQLAHGLESVLGPLARARLPVQELAMIMTITLRFVPTLFEEIEGIARAQTARGADFHSGGPIRRARSLIPVFVPIFVSAVRRADELAMAMDARCFRGAPERTHMRQLRLGIHDLIAVVAVFLIILASVAVERLTWGG